MSLRRSVIACLVLWILAAPLWSKPTLFLIGDSTVRNSTGGQMGWGDPLVAEFDPAKIEVVNRAIGGRSSRTFLTDGRWDAVMAHLKPGDFVLMQFGHNDGGPLNDERCRASIKGIGGKSERIVRQTDGKPETVQTYGWYLTKYIRDAKSKGAFPVLVSPIPRNIWKDGKIGRSDKDYGHWAKLTADQERVPFIDFNGLLADRFESLGQEKTAELYAGSDHTHTGPKGAAFIAAVMAEAIRSLTDCDLSKGLLPGDLWLPAVFSDHMVLQRDMPVPVWGTAVPGVEVSAKLGGQSVSAKADENGRWRIDLPAMAAGGPFTLEVTAKRVIRSFSDVLVGEVWLCSGQSNMDVTLAPTVERSFSGVTDWKNEVAAANHPQLRMFTAERTLREHPQREVVGKWSVCTPESAGDFSAVAYYFGLALHQDLGVPVGLVTCALGASTIESWIRAETLQAHPQFEGLLKAFDTKSIAFRDNPKAFEDYGMQLAKMKHNGRAQKNPDPVQDQHNPFVVHNGMIAPIVPYALRGAIWYQGEFNLNTRSLYPDLHKALIEDWRTLWKNSEMPFYFVQLAAHKAPSIDSAGGGQIAEMREAQARSLAVRHSGMAATIDVGDEKDVHPRNKRDLGKRLARLALSKTYGKSHVPNSQASFYLTKAASPEDFLEKPDAWFGSPEARAIAAHILSWQSAQGSWPKNKDTTRAAFTGDRSKLSGTFDNRATTGELRFLARAFRATGDAACRTALLTGIDHILRAQYSNGGWPQYFPPGKGYAKHITFNDGCMIRLMEFLREVATADEYKFIDSQCRDAAVKAIERGIECIVKCQVIVRGTPTVWCAQHDEITLAPAAARNYELVSLSGSESADILGFLMSIKNPAPEVIRAVNAGAAWFASSKIEGIRVVKTGDDSEVVKDTAAPPLWARFYQTKTNRPIFCGRDGVMRYELAEIDAERRNGYAWYGNWGEKVAKAHGKWPHH